jgi:hypothetical protein
MAGLDRLRPGPAFGLGALAAAVNPKNAALTISTAASVAAAGLPGSQQAITLAVFVLLGSAGILAPLGIYLATGERRAAVNPARPASSTSTSSSLPSSR